MIHCDESEENIILIRFLIFDSMQHIDNNINNGINRTINKDTIFNKIKYKSCERLALGLMSLLRIDWTKFVFI